MMHPPSIIPPVTILIIDDSIIIRGIINRILVEVAHFKVIGSAIDGQSAVRMAEELRPDFVILDINMPRKDGIAALPEIIAASPKTKVIIASSATSSNAELSMKALSLGASECLNMPDAKNKHEIKRFGRDLVNCIIALSTIANSGANSGATPMPLNASNKLVDKLVDKSEIAANPTQPAIHASYNLHTQKYPNILKAIAIGSSTGGPHALAQLFKQLNGNVPNVPIFITQHMPPTFTSILAANLASVSGVKCVEAVDGEVVQPKHIYVAPGDYHMTAIKQGGDVIIRINQASMENYCRPSVDPMMRSLVEIYGRNMMLIMLTGMGHDGLQGARALHTAGGVIVAQDKSSSVVWGMPKAVVDAGIAGAILPLDSIAKHITHAFNSGGVHYAT